MIQKMILSVYTMFGYFRTRKSTLPQLNTASFVLLVRLQKQLLLVFADVF